MLMTPERRQQIDACLFTSAPRPERCANAMSGKFAGQAIVNQIKSKKRLPITQLSDGLSEREITFYRDILGDIDKIGTSQICEMPVFIGSAGKTRTYNPSVNSISPFVTYDKKSQTLTIKNVCFNPFYPFVDPKICNMR